jgi:hypothetical protein
MGEDDLFWQFTPGLDLDRSRISGWKPPGKKDIAIPATIILS